MNRKEQDLLVEKVVEEIYEEFPFLIEKFGQNGRERTKEDNYHHLNHLQSAYEMNSYDFFLDYTIWLNDVLTSRGVGTNLIEDNFKRLIRLLENIAAENEKERKVYIDYLTQSLQHLPTLSNEGGGSDGQTT